MDPGGMLNDGGGPFNLAEIWQFSINGRGVGGSPNMAQFCGCDSNLDAAAGGSERLHLSPAGSSRKRREEEEAAATSNGNGNGVNDNDGKRKKTSGCGEEVNEGKAEVDSAGKAVEQKKQPPEPPKDYIHVRARRGQATDSHSLAERARREKISERMKILQDLVPGCNKVIGKALVLDEIINYIQSLQRQVEFLSMKLEAVNSRMTPGIEGFPPKEFAQQPFENPGMPFGSQPTREYSRGASPEWLHMQVGGGFDRTS